MNKTQILTADVIKEKVLAFIKDNFLLGIGVETIRDDDSFLSKGIIDSTGVLELVSFVEDTFGMKVEDEELIPENLDSLNNITKYIQSKLAGS